jgi:hypothetical protein
MTAVGRPTREGCGGRARDLMLCRRSTGGSDGEIPAPGVNLSLLQTRTFPDALPLRSAFGCAGGSLCRPDDHPAFLEVGDAVVDAKRVHGALPLEVTALVDRHGEERGLWQLGLDLVQRAA